MIQTAPTPAQTRVLHEVTNPAQPPGCPRALPKVSRRPEEPRQQQRAKCREGHKDETPGGLPAPVALEQL